MHPIKPISNVCETCANRLVKPRKTRARVVAFWQTHPSVIDHACLCRKCGRARKDLADISKGAVKLKLVPIEQARARKVCENPECNKPATVLYSWGMSYPGADEPNAGQMSSPIDISAYCDKCAENAATLIRLFKTLSCGWAAAEPINTASVS